ncbi:DMT family transporter [Saxibacter everestensis]|uniref:DMT family transporter n=1 Tax=Saxibacter everestensis TaxID=2909229 RepID=A0ABY8QSU4_9MICO|nr:DMT family transporter [Brevibacteriaceae bacterium ZFBP1038]
MNLLLAAAFVICWSSGFIGAKLGAGSADASTILMWRFLPLTLLLAVVVFAVQRNAFRALGSAELGRQAAIGILSQSGYLLTVYYAIQLGVSSGTTALIDGTQPLVAGALAGPLLKQHISARQWLGFCLGLAGVIVVTTADASASAGVAWWAYAVPFVGMFCLIAATFIERGFETSLAPLPTLLIHCTTSAAIFSVLAISTGNAVPPAEPSFWLAIGWLVILSTFGGYGLYWIILNRSGVTKVNTLMFLMAPVTTIWGALAFGEPLGVQTIAGLTLGLLAVIIVYRYDRTQVRTEGQNRRQRTRSATP